MPLKITIQDIKAHHPKGVNAPSEFYYMRLANRLLAITGQSLMSPPTDSGDATAHSPMRDALDMLPYGSTDDT